MNCLKVSCKSGLSLMCYSLEEVIEAWPPAVEVWLVLFNLSTSSIASVFASD
jgi:hypothetical protein